MSNSNTGIDLKSFKEDTLFPSLFECLDQAFRDMEFKQYGSQWRSRYHLDGARDKQGKEVTYVYENNKGRAIDTARGENKSLIDLYMELNGMDFMQALRELSSICGVVLPEHNSEEWRAYQQKLEGMEQADEIFRTALQKDTAEAKQVREYLKGRQWTDEEIRLAGLGLITTDMIPGLPDSQLYSLRAGKAVVGETHLLAIPYRSGNSVLGFKFREVAPSSDKGTPKYLNTRGLKKGGYFFGLGIGVADDIVIVEGELDALHAQVRGAKNVVATAGGRVTTTQIQDATNKGVNKFTLLFDNDDRGREFIDSTVEVIARTAGSVKSSIYVANLPEGFKDTDEYLASHSIDEFNAIVASAQPYSLYRINNIVEDYLAKQEKGVTDKEQATLCRTLIDAINEPYVLPTERRAIYNALASRQEELGFNVDDLREQANKVNQYEETDRKKKELERATAKVQQLLQEEKVEDARELMERTATAKGTKARAREYEEVFTPKRALAYDKFLGEVQEGIPTGYIFKDGLKEERLTLNSGLTFVCGYRGHGKTTFLNNIALNDVKRNLDLGNGKSVLYFSYEVDKRRLILDLLNTYVNDPDISANPANTILSYFKTKKGERADRYFQKDESKDDKKTGTKWHYKNFLEKKDEFFNDYLASGALVVVDETYKVETLLDAIKYYISSRDVSIVCIDYAQLIYSEEFSRQRTEEIKKVVNDIKDFANKQGIPFVLAAQFNRNVYSPATVDTTNIGEGGDFERIADTCIGLFNLKELKPTPSDKEDNEAKDIISRLDLHTYKKGERLAPIPNKLFVRLMKRRYGYFPIDVTLEWTGSTKKIEQNDTEALKVKGWVANTDAEEEQDEEPITF